MIVDFIEAIAVLVQRIADGVRALPEGVVEHIDVFFLNRCLVTLEELADLFDDFGDVGCPVGGRHAASPGDGGAVGIERLGD